MSPLSKGRHLAGRRETGLTDPQRHFAIALGRLLLADGSGFMNGEMGMGKTTVSLAVVEYLRTAFERKGSHQPAYPRLNGGLPLVTHVTLNLNKKALSEGNTQGASK